MIKIGILGAAGYTGGELIRLLINHPEAQIVFANSESNAGNNVADIHEGLYGDTDMKFTADMPFDDVDVIFFCFGHGKSEAFIKEHHIPQHVRIIDLAQDFRIAGNDSNADFMTPANHDFVYGLPEINRELIANAQHVANPGCFATAIQLALLPLAKNLLLNKDVHVFAITGSTGAGVKPAPTSHFSWRNDNISIYKPFRHQHLDEIRQSLSQLQNSFASEIDFIPVRGCFSRGIFATLYLDCPVELSEIRRLYDDYYSDHNFTFVTDKMPDLKDVVNTNKCLLHLEKEGNKLIIVSVIDNLLKGASGTAVHNMNLLFGLHERTGLCLKGSAF